VILFNIPLSKKRIRVLDSAPVLTGARLRFIRVCHKKTKLAMPTRGVYTIQPLNVKSVFLMAHRHNIM